MQPVHYSVTLLCYIAMLMEHSKVTQSCYTVIFTEHYSVTLLCYTAVYWNTAVLYCHITGHAGQSDERA